MDQQESTSQITSFDLMSNLVKVNGQWPKFKGQHQPV